MAHLPKGQGVFLPPFKAWLASNIPAVYDNTMTYYEELCALIKYLQDVVIPALNHNAEAVTTIATAVEQLQKYVEDYFKNLDVQEEINNKLDQMTEDGTLQEIIGAYLNATAVWGFDTVADMKASTNLIDGSYARTMGYYAKNDGGGGLYKIRNITNDDVIDEGSIVEMNDDQNQLIAELIVENEVNVKQFGAKGDSVTSDTLSFQRAINYAQSNNIKLVINEGEYIISQIVISDTLNVEGFGESSVIKSVSNNANDCIVKLLNDGMQDTILSNFVIDGNKTNNSNAVDGIKLINNLEGSNSEDRRTKIEDIFVKYCSGNGITTQGDMSNTDIHEIRVTNCILRSNDEYGIKLSSCTDSLFTQITSFGNKKSGFHVEGGDHKFEGCKAFANGYGDETTIETLRRIPASAFTQTSDTTPVSGKTYYTRSGKNINGNWYIFTEFSGSAFAPSTDYYEMTTTYYKKYAGFEVYNSPVTVFSNCEAQENYGDGFTFTTTYGNQLTNVVTDNNGIIDWTTTYAEAGKEQLYYGIYMYNSSRMNINSYSRNFRGTTLGLVQKAPVMCDNSSTIQGVIGSEGQVSNTVLVEDTTGTNLIDTVEIHNNGKPFVHSLRQEDVTLLEAGTSWWRFEAERFNETNYLNIIIDKSGGILTDTNEHVLFNLPYAFRPNKAVLTEAMLSYNHGYNIVDTCSLLISTDGNVSIRKGTTSTADSVIIRLDYTKLI